MAWRKPKYQTIKRWFRPREQDTGRRGEWDDAVGTDRLNAARWSGATSRTINEQSQNYLMELWDRSDLEVGRNGILNGVVETHVTDIVGEHGPDLQVHSSNEAYNEALEQVWADWCRDCDAGGQLELVDKIALWIRYFWTRGEALEQLVMDGDADGVGVRLQSIEPRRLVTPAEMVGDETVAQGVRRTREGRPLQYFITDTQAGFTPLTDTQVPVDADNIIHLFKLLDAGQVRGVPWTRPVLDGISLLRQYDKHVLEAARVAALLSLFMHTQHPDAPYLNIDEPDQLDIESGVLSSLPPGWDVKTLEPTQPSTNYVDFRHERLREIGRGVGMPLMTVLLDSSKHNYSSARFDGQIYQRVNRRIQNWISRRALRRIVAEVAREAERLRLVPPRPADAHYQWTWPATPHVDPQKEAKAEDIKLSNKSLSLTEALAARGVSLEEHVELLRRERDLLTAAGLVETGGDSGDEDDDAAARAMSDAIESAIADALDDRR